MRVGDLLDIAISVGSSEEEDASLMAQCREIIQSDWGLLSGVHAHHAYIICGGKYLGEN